MKLGSCTFQTSTEKTC